MLRQPSLIARLWMKSLASFVGGQPSSSVMAYSLTRARSSVEAVVEARNRTCVPVNSHRHGKPARRPRRARAQPLAQPLGSLVPPDHLDLDLLPGTVPG